MELLFSNIKKYLGNRNPNEASYILKNRTFQPKPPKIKKNPLQNKIPYISGNRTLRLKNLSYFLKEKLLLYFLKKTVHIFWP